MKYTSTLVVSVVDLIERREKTKKPRNSRVDDENETQFKISHDSNDAKRGILTRNTQNTTPMCTA